MGIIRHSEIDDLCRFLGGFFALPKEITERATHVVDEFNGQAVFAFIHNEMEGITMPLDLEYFYGNEAEQYSFYRIPKKRLLSSERAYLQ